MSLTDIKDIPEIIKKQGDGFYKIKVKDGKIVNIIQEENLTPYQKTVELLTNYNNLKNRIDYLKNNLDNIELKKIYSINEIKAINKNNLSDLEKIEIIKEQRLKEIGVTEGIIDFIDYGLSFIKNEKYEEIISLIYFQKFRIEGVANKFNVDERTIKRNRNILINKIATNLFQNDILLKLNKLIS